MLLMTKSVLVMMISFILSIVTALIIIPIFKRNAKQSISKHLEEAHRNKKNVPTMGGLIFIIPTLITILILLLTDKIEANYSLIILMFTFIGYSIVGFIDDYLIVKRKNNKGLKEGEKLLFQLIIAIIFFYLFMISGNEPLIWIHSLNIKINVGFIYGIFILLILLSSSNAVNLTDGLDGLAGGLSVIALLTFGIISYNSGWLEGYDTVGLFCFSLIGSILGFLIFNTNPARIFMGDTGSLALGATLGSLAILTRYELLLLVIGIVFVIETLSCILQRYYYKLTKKRLFPMAPLHHAFEKKGWSESDIVKLFWIVGLLGSMIVLTFGVWY